MSSPSDQNQAGRCTPEGKKSDEFSASSPPTALPIAEESDKCMREVFMNSVETLLDAIDGFLDSFPFAQACIHRDYEANVQEGTEKVEELKMKLEGISASLSSLFTVQDLAKCHVENNLHSHKGSLQKREDRVTSIKQKVKQLKDEFEYREKDRSAFDREQQATDQSHHHHLSMSEQHSRYLARIGKTARDVSDSAKYMTEYQQHQCDLETHNEELSQGGPFVSEIDRLTCVMQELEAKGKLEEAKGKLEEINKSQQKQIDMLKMENDELRKKTDELSRRMSAFEQDKRVTDQLAQEFSCVKMDSDLSVGIQDGQSPPRSESADTGVGKAKGRPTEVEGQQHISRNNSSDQKSEVISPVEETGNPGANSIQDFFAPYSGRFQEKMEAKDCVDQLCNKGIISSAVKQKICSSADRKAANISLYEHVVVQGDYVSTVNLCDVMIDSKGYAQMSTLGKKMKKDLENNKERLKSS